MQRFSAKAQLLVRVSLILVFGFALMSAGAYFSARDAVHRALHDVALPGTNDAIFAELQQELMRPVAISEAMAHNGLLRKWVMDGEKDTAPLMAYLDEMRRVGGPGVTAWLVSAQTRRYYNGGSPVRSLEEQTPSDDWFDQIRKNSDGHDYQINIDRDLQNERRFTIYVNYYLRGTDGSFLGVTGLGFTRDTLIRTIRQFQQRYHRTIYFTNAKGEIVVADGRHQLGQSLQQDSGLAPLIPTILNRSSQSSQLQYTSGGKDVMLNSRYIPEMGWYLLVEQDVDNEILPLKRVFGASLAGGLALTLAVLGLVLATIKGYQSRMEKMATTDLLTGLHNRQALVPLFLQMAATARRTGKQYCVILFDLDHFKRINDTYGHLEGDRVLVEVAAIARACVRESDVVARWGGEEFMIVLQDCPAEKAAQLAETLRARVAGHDFALTETGHRVTISAGYTQYRAPEESFTLLARADAAMYRAKGDGRNRICGDVAEDAAAA